MPAQNPRALLALLLVLLPALPVPSAGYAQSRTLPVPIVTIYPGDTIGDGQIGERAFSAAAVAGSVIDGRSQLVGKVARRTLLPGRPVPLNAIKAVDLVTRNAPVRLVFQEAGLSISAFATPLQDGGEGDLIRVRNLDSGSIILGTVQADGTVRVGSP